MTNFLIIFILSVFIVLLSWLYLHFKERYRFWKMLNVPFLQPTFPFGNTPEILSPKHHFGYIMENLYQKMKSFGDYGGVYFFRDPVLVVLTPEFAKTVLVKDFQYFLDRGVYSNEKHDPLSANLFFLEGERWKKLRAKLTPTFTSGKLKNMFNTILDVGEELNKFLEPLADVKADIEVRDILARFTTDIIGSTAFGIDCNSLHNPNSKFRVMGRRMINFSKLKALKIFFAMFFRERTRKMGIRFNDVDVSEFFMQVVRDTIEFREKNNVQRKDFMQLLIDLKNTKGAEDEKLSFEEIAAQAFVFFFAGFETSATTLTFALHLLATHEEIQIKARESVHRVLDKFDGKFTYEAIMEMDYVDKVIQETLRLYPPVATIHRISTKPYKLPNGSILPKGVGVVIPNLAFQRDAEHFLDPLAFSPERDIRPFESMPFGEGPRVCIGMRFGLLQSRLGLATILNSFKVGLCKRTIQPLRIDPVNLLHTPAHDVWLNIEKI